MRLVAAPHKKQRKNKRSAQAAALLAVKAAIRKRRHKRSLSDVLLFADCHFASGMFLVNFS
jgi:hypothetical protein